MRKIIFKILFPIILIGPYSKAQKYVPSSENLESREWFQNARFGLFVHWGVFSILGDVQWVMNNQNQNNWHGNTLLGKIRRIIKKRQIVLAVGLSLIHI